MRLTARQLTAATLERQLLLRRLPLGVGEAVRRLGALQSQEPASPYLALWSRLAGFDPGQLDAAYAGGEVVKASLMRITLHTVHAEDYAPFHSAMVSSLRAARLRDARFTSTGLTVADAEALLPVLAQFLADPRAGAEIEKMIVGRLGERGHRAWWALRTFAPLHHALPDGTWTFGRRARFVAAPADTAPVPDVEGVQRLLLRYLDAFGPASARDFARFTLLGSAVVSGAVLDLGERVVRRQGPAGEALLDVPGAVLPAEDVATPPRLLPMWDSVLLAFADAGRILPAEYRSLVVRRNGDVLASVLVDGQVVGVWRPADGGIEVTTFRPLDDDVWAALAGEATALGALLADRDPAVYRRYGHWWDKGLPGAQVQVLAG